MTARKRVLSLVGIAAALLVACLGVVGCTGPAASPSAGPSSPAGMPQAPATEPPSDVVRIRVSNDGTAVLGAVVVKFPGGEGIAAQDESYGDVAPGATSEYREIGRAYSYAYVEALVDGEKRVLQPIDYVGEVPLAPGDYTYILRSSSRSPLGIELELHRD